jgi:diguanylate cyclase (GGDEF)-like protein
LTDGRAWTVVPQVPGFRKQSGFVVATGILCLLAGLLGQGCAASRATGERLVRVGVDNSPPYSFLDAQGKGRGLAVDLINEAARRRNITIVWVPVTGLSPDDALALNRVDLWPVLGTTSERLKRLHLTGPLFQNEFCLISSRDKAIVSEGDIKGKTIAFTNRPLASEMAHRLLHGARLLATPSNHETFEALCAGAASAAFIEARTLEAFLFNRSQGCRDIALSVHYVKDAVSYAGIGARKPSGKIADELHAEIMNLVSDGTFSDRVEHWASFSGGEMRSLFALQKACERDRILMWSSVVFLGVILAMGLLLIVVWRSRAVSENGRALEAIRSDVLRRVAAGDPLDHILAILVATIQMPYPDLGCAIRLEGASGELSLDGGEHAARQSLERVWPILASDGRTLGRVVIKRAVSHSLRPLSKRQTDLIERVTGLSAIVIENKALHTELEHEATHDRLTGLANRRMFTEKMAALERYHGQDPRQDRTATIFFVDLDRFKQINDGFGHQIGDCYLRRAADEIRACFSPSALVARIGGDEFTVIAEGLDEKEVLAACAGIMERFRRPFEIQGMQIFGSVSTGVSSWPRDGRTSAEIQSNADSALYEAKEQGRNQYRIYTPSMRSRATSRMQTEQLVRQALDGQMFQLFYQPQVDGEGRLLGLEALVRITHPERGLIAPDSFITVAEDTGLITEIDARVMSEACRQMAAWRREGYEPVRVAVNISRASLVSADIVEDICDTLSREGVSPAYVQMELTETAALRGGEVSREALRRIRDAGISLALDDFGTGYSSLSCLHSLPVDTVKIDKSFIRHLAEDATSLPLVEAVIAASRSLGMTIVAEGVETREQFRLLRRLGCDVLQGHFISPPIDAEAVAAGILTRSPKPGQGSQPSENRAILAHVGG